MATINDFYLNDENVLNRLISEYNKYNSLIVAYDFDNTVHDYHGEGHSYSQVVGLLRKLKEIGCYLIVFTASEESRHNEISEYLDSNNIPFDSINENAPHVSFNGGKFITIFYLTIELD